MTMRFVTLKLRYYPPTGQRSPCARRTTGALRWPTQHFPELSFMRKKKSGVYQSQSVPCMTIDDFT